MRFKAGDKVDGASSGTLAVIYDLSSLKMEMNVNELDIGKVRPGQTVEITAAALPGQTFRGVVDRVSINGTTTNGFDCSGYLQYVFSQNGYALPRTADLQFKLGLKTTNADQLVPGDLVFFQTYAKGASHCGIYLGSGQFIHASSSKGIRIDKLNDPYWKNHYYGGKHIVNTKSK